MKKYCEKSNDYKVLHPDILVCGNIRDNIYKERKELAIKQAKESKKYINSDNTYKEIEEIIDTNKTLILSTKNTSDENKTHIKYCQRIIWKI